MTIQKQILNSVSSQIIYIFVLSVVGLALVPITINMLGSFQYGAFELILSLILIDVFLEFGLGATLIKYIPEYKEDRVNLKKFVWSYYYIKMFLSSLGFFVIVIIGYYFDSIFNLDKIDNVDELKSSVYIFAVGLLVNSMATFLDNFLKGFVYFGLANMARILSTLFFFIVYYMYYSVSDCYNITYIALIWFLLKPLFLVINLILILRYIKLDYILQPVGFDYSSVKMTLRYMFGMTYIVMIAQLYNKMPKIILGVFTTPIYVAYWGIMEKIKEPLLQLQSSMLRPLIPILSDTKNISELNENKILQIVRLQYFFISFIGVMVITHIDLLVYLWIGKEFNIVANITKIAVLGFMFPNSGVFLMMYYAKGLTKINSQFITINTFFSLIAGTSILIMSNNIQWFMWSFVLILIVTTNINIMRYLDYFKINKIKYFTYAIVQPLMVSLVFYILHTTQYTSDSILGLLTSIIVSSIGYIMLFFIFFRDEDKKLMIKLIRKIKW